MAAATAEPQSAAIPGALGVQIEKPAGDNVHFAEGSGVFIGGGLVLTAAHVVQFNARDPKVTVAMDGWRTDGQVVATAPAGLDLALVKIAPGELSSQRRDLHPVELCAMATAPNQPVVVAAQGAVTLSKTVGEPIRSSTLNGDWTTILATGYSHGASGGGVFDALKGCLAGIIVIEAVGAGVELTEFVPAARIAPFLAVASH
jgi:hypothetical protein